MAELETLEIDDEDEDEDEEFQEDDPDDDAEEEEAEVEEAKAEEQQLHNIPPISKVSVASESVDKAVEENILKPMTTGIFLLRRRVGGGNLERRKSGELELPSQETLKMLKRR